MNLCLILMIAFLVKHFVVDFLLQTPYMYLNKGIWLHPGGVIHAALHGIFSLGIFIIFIPEFFGWIFFISVLAEVFIHYGIDYSKVNIGSRYKWGPTNSENFWRLLGLDQLLHGLTYIWMIFMVVKA